MARNLIFVALLVVVGCGGPQPSHFRVKDFSGQRAYAQVAKLVSFGPRPSGSRELEQSGNYIIAQLRADGLKVEEQTFRAGTPRGPMEFRNLVAKTRSSRRNKIIVIGSHYDTKWFTHIRFVGANDGGSSSGVLLELARVAAHEPDLCFVFFDGEEAMQDYGQEDGLWGSKFFVESLKADGKVGSVEAMILLDMVGDRDLGITMPANSTGSLVEQVFQAASSLGWRDLFAYGRGEILDDHEPFLEAGIPAVDLIDFEFGSAPGRNDYWHTAQDTLDKLSPLSLEVAGRVTLRVVERLQRPTAR